MVHLPVIFLNSERGYIKSLRKQGKIKRYYQIVIVLRENVEDGWKTLVHVVHVLRRT